MSTGIFNKFTGYHNRRSTRLPGYDYSRPGYYFITVCIHDRRERLFGDIDFAGAGSKPALESFPAFGRAPGFAVSARMHLNEFDNIVQMAWVDLINHVSGIALDTFIIMPNHVHGIIRISGAGFEPAPTENTPKQIALPEIIRQFKTFSARRINSIRNARNDPVWQRNYYDHLIRNEKSLYFIRKYIDENPLNWSDDSENHIDREIEKYKMVEIGEEK